MKRIGAIICLLTMMVSLLAPASFAATDSNNQKTSLAIESSTPHDGGKGVSVENLSVKIYFNKEVMPDNDKIKKSNEKQFKLTDKDGNKIPIKVYYSEAEREEGLLMVVSDIHNKSKTKIQGNTDYTLTIGKNLQATDGSKLGSVETISFKTLDQGKSTMVYTIMMVVMIGGMIFFTSKSAKKAMEKENQEKGKSETVNPYKEAKRTGKSVEEIVAKDKQRKAKEAEVLAKKKAKEAEIMAALEEDEPEVSGNKRVSAPKPISACGSAYKVTVVKTQKKENKGTTNPKNKSGKQKNSKNKNKKK